MAASISKDIINRETDARFWATGYRPGHKLDPNNPTDKAMLPVWMDIFRKVSREADAGTLVTTYDHPEIAQHLADAAVANKAAAAHADIAASSTDPWAVQDNVAAATTATQISAQKAQEAAAKQPPTVSSKLVQDAGKVAAKTPPPAHAPSADHIAHAQTQTKPPAFPREVLYKETNARFWAKTHYKPGQRLDMSIDEDRKQSKIWLEIFRQVQREADAGTLVLTSPELVPPAPMPPPQVTMPPGAVRPPMGPPMQQWPPMGPPMQQRSPMQQWPPMQQRPPMPMGPRPQLGPMGPMGQRPQLGPMGPRPQLGPMGPMGPRPQMGPMGPVSPEGGLGAPPGGPEGAPTPSTQPSGAADTSAAQPPSEEPSSIGKYLAIGIAVIAGGGLLYYATTRKSSSKSSPRARTPKVLLATPVRAVPTTGVPAFPPARARP